MLASTDDVRRDSRASPCKDFLFHRITSITHLRKIAPVENMPEEGTGSIREWERQAKWFVWFWQSWSTGGANPNMLVFYFRVVFICYFCLLVQSALKLLFALRYLELESNFGVEYWENSPLLEISTVISRISENLVSVKNQCFECYNSST